MFAMAGGSLAHARIITNILRSLSNQLQGRDCEPFVTDLRLHIAAAQRLCYESEVDCRGPLSFDSTL